MKGRSAVKIIHTSSLPKMSAEEQHQVYCGLDSCILHEILKVRDQLDEETGVIYDFARALQAPVLEMMLRGIATDPFEVAMLLGEYRKQREHLRAIVQRYGDVVWGKPLNPASPQQLIAFFYDTMGIPRQYAFDKGERRVTTNREALENIQSYRYARPIALAILAFRDAAKRVGVLESGIDDDGRMRFRYNIGGTNSGRFSCNENDFGGGTNGQNITDELRIIFVASPGKKLAYLDLAQAESRAVAYISGDENYISACEQSDVHTAVAQLIWPELPWSANKTPATARALAELKFWRHWTRRELGKRGGHLTNYVGGPETNAKKLNVSIEIMRQFQSIYFVAFSGIRRMHGDTARVLHTTATLTTPLGRKRYFFGRNYAPDILRKGVAYRPQSSVADILNLGMWKVWKYLPEVDLLAQLHDAILIEYDDDPAVEARVLRKAQQLMEIPIQVTDTKLHNGKTRTMLIPVDAQVGWNWAKASKTNPDGLASLPETRTRQVIPGESLLKRIVSH